MDIEKINRLRKLRDEIDKLIDEEVNKHEPLPYQPIYPNPYVPIYPIYIPPTFPAYRQPYDWEITWTC